MSNDCGDGYYSRDDSGDGVSPPPGIACMDVRAMCSLMQMYHRYLFNGRDFTECFD